MAEQITIQISKRVIRQAARTAVKNQQRIEEVLSNWLEKMIAELPVDELPDDEVLALAGLKLTREQEARLSKLLTQNREGTLDAAGQRELDELMHLYEHGLLRKSQALRVAVQRRLRKPLQP